jgi:hypothetical protein
MRYENSDMMMRELSSAETDEVVGGVGTAEIVAIAQSGAGSSLTSHGGAFTLATTNTTAAAAIAANFTVTGANNFLVLQAVGVVA